MKVPFLNLTAQYRPIKDKIAAALQEVLDTNAFAGGRKVERFENVFAPFCQTEHAIGVGSGTDALWMALLGLGIGDGDAVIVPVNTFIATAEAVSLCGATPVFVDCDRYYNIDVEKIAAAIQKSEVRRQNSEGTRQGTGNRSQNSGIRSGELADRIRAIMPVHLYGQMANMDEIMALAEEYGLAVIEDACQAHGAEYKGRRAGSIGDAGCFSFYPGKNLGAYGEAGAIVTNNAELAEKLRMFRDHGQQKKYYHSIIGWNARMDGFQGAVLATKLKYLDEWTKKRRQNAQLYNELLAGVDGIQTPKEMPHTSSVYHLYVIQSDDRDGLQHYLERNGVATGLHYPVPLHLQEAYSSLGYEEGDFPMAEGAARRILSLPMYPELTERQVRYVCDKISEFRRQEAGDRRQETGSRMQRKPAKSFQDLIVWQKAHQFALMVYKYSNNFPKTETYGLTSQFRRAAISIPANIAEGFKKKGKADKARFLNIAQGSLEECRYYLILSKDLDYGDPSVLGLQLTEISKLLEAYSSSILNSTS